VRCLRDFGGESTYTTIEKSSAFGALVRFHFRASFFEHRRYCCRRAGEQRSPRSGSDEGESTFGEGEAPDSPLVFQCSRCRCIVGDSFSFVCADQALRLVCLSAVTDVVESTQRAVMSTSGPDEGCVYKELVCKTCQDHKLGKLYTATPKQLMHMQQLYSLETDAISSFVLGSGDLWAEGYVLERLPSIQHLRSITGDMMKLQHVLIGIDARLQNIEAALKELEEFKTRF